MTDSPRTQRALAIAVGQFLRTIGFTINRVPIHSYQVYPGIHVYGTNEFPGHLVMAIERPGANYLATYVHIPDDELLLDLRTEIILRVSEEKDRWELQLLAGMIQRHIGRPVIVYHPGDDESATEVDQEDRLDDQPRTK